MKVSVQIEGVEFRMEVETGAAASILYYTDYERYFKYLAVRPSGNIIPFLCWCTAGHFRTDCMRRTMAAMPIYARYFPVIFLAFFYVNIYFSRLFSFLQSFSLGRSDFKSSPEQFLSLEAKAICIAAGVLMD